MRDAQAALFRFFTFDVFFAVILCLVNEFSKAAIWTSLLGIANFFSAPCFQVEVDSAVGESSPHIANIGRMVEVGRAPFPLPLFLE